MISIKDIYYVAGVLEGEGCFGSSNYGKNPCIWLQMSDLDVVRRVRNLCGSIRVVSSKPDKRSPHYKDSHRMSLNGHLAIGWMMTLYPLMSLRRKAEIREALSSWRS